MKKSRSINSPFSLCFIEKITDSKSKCLLEAFGQ